MSKTKKEGGGLAKDVLEHRASIEMGLKQLTDKWTGLKDSISRHGQKLESAMDYFQHLQKADYFIKDSNRVSLLFNFESTEIFEDAYWGISVNWYIIHYNTVVDFNSLK